MTATEQMLDRARAVMPGGVSHPMRHTRDGGTAVFTHGAGSRVWDADGREYIDYLMGSAALMLGHADPRVVQAIVEQAGHGTFFCKTHPLEVEWAERISRMVPSAERVRFTGSGSESTMLAMRVARAHTGKPLIIRFEGHYHGWADPCLYGSEAPYDRVPGNGVAPSVRDAVLLLPTSVERVAEALRSRDDIAAVMLEPSGANWGCVPIDADFVREMRRLTTEAGVLLVLDEVITGFRWSPSGAQGVMGVTPDLSTFAKIAAGGMPGGALGGRAEVMSCLEPDADPATRVLHKGTFNGAPIIAAPAIATLDALADGTANARASTTAATLREALREVMSTHQVRGAVYGDASTFHVWFGDAPARDSVAGIAPAVIRGLPGALVQDYQRTMREHGVNIMSYLGGVVSCAHTSEDVTRTVEAFDATLSVLKPDLPL